jgi:hypothetical protein
MLMVIDDADGTEYLNWTVEGSAGETTFTLGGSSDVYGCTDPAAANYNPDATIDDGAVSTGAMSVIIPLRQWQEVMMPVVRTSSSIILHLKMAVFPFPRTMVAVQHRTHIYMSWALAPLTNMVT